VSRGALRHRAFRLLFAGQSISSFGDRLVPVALAFAVLDLTGSVTDLGIVLAAQTVPLVVFVLVGGVWSDRLSRRRVMLASDYLRAAAQGASAVLLLTGTAHISELAALQAVYGFAEAFFGPAAVAVVPETVDQASLQQANALLGLSSNFAAVLGPAVAGVIVATTRPGWALAIDAATFLGSAACLTSMPAELAAASVRTTMVRDLRTGWQAFRARAWLWITVAYFTLYVGFCFAPLQVLGPQVARLWLGGPEAWATISVALGVGALAGGLLGLRWRPRYPLRVAFAVFVISTPALIALIAAHAPVAVIAAVALLDGGTGTLFNTFWFTALQSEVPAGELSRVSSWDYLGSLALAPVGQAVSGPIALAVGLSTSLYGAAILALVLFIGALAAPAVRNFSPAALADPQSGPTGVNGAG
jgi:predicted MFS family arabinose efflux permease